jgi:hypothetical protein
MKEPNTFPFADAHDLNNLQMGYPTALLEAGDASPFDNEPIGRRSFPRLISSDLSPVDLDPQLMIDRLLDRMDDLLEAHRDHPERFHDPEVVGGFEELLEQLDHLVGIVKKEDLEKVRVILAQLAA